jgi:hypothetical protein
MGLRPTESVKIARPVAQRLFASVSPFSEALVFRTRLLPLVSRLEPVHLGILSVLMK